MTRQLSRQNHAGDEPFYGKYWSKLKQFSSSLSKGAETAPNISGPAATAIISAAIGCFTMMVTHHLSDTSKARETIVWNVGTWIPGSKTDSELWGNLGKLALPLLKI